MTTIRLKIINWRKYNPRTDRKMHTWFRLNHDLAYSAEFSGFNTLDYTVFLFVLCEASKQIKKTSDSEIYFNVSLTSFFLKEKEHLILESIQALERIGVVAVTGRLPTGDRAVSLRTNERTNERIISPHSAAEIDNKLLNPNSEHPKKVNENGSHLKFEYLYSLYPKKMGKKKGMEICRRVIKNQENFDKVVFAIQKYSEFVKREKKEKQFILYFSTFMNSWEEWLDDDAGETSIEVQQGDRDGLSGYSIEFSDRRTDEG